MEEKARLRQGDSASGARSRSIAIDLLRLIGIVAVVVGHLEQNTIGGTAVVVRGSVLFFFLAGYLWHADRTVGKEAALRARTLLVPFVVWGLLIGSAVAGYQVFRGHSPAHLVDDLLIGGHASQGVFAPFWFLPVLFACTVLYRALGRVLPEAAIIAIAWIAALACSFWGRPLALVPHDVLFAVPMLVIVTGGRAVRAFEKRVPRRAMLGAGLVAVCSTLALTGVLRPLDIKSGDFGTPILSLLNALMLCIGLLWTCHAVLPPSRQPAWGATVSDLAQTSVVVLLTHVLVSQVAGYVGAPAAVGLILALTVPFVLGLALRRTALSPLFVGMPRKRRSSPGSRGSGSGTGTPSPRS